MKMTYLNAVVHALDDNDAFNSLWGHSSQADVNGELFSSPIVVFVKRLNFYHASDAITVSKELI